MGRIRLAVIAYSLISILGTHASSAYAHHFGGGAIAAGIIGLAVGAAVDNAVHRDEYVYGPPRPVYRAGTPFSPHFNVMCYPAQRACYNNGGYYNPNWSYRVFAN